MRIIRIMKYFPVFLVLMYTSFLSACAEREDVVAYVGRETITERDFRERINELPGYYLGFMASEGGKRQYLEGMIKEELLIQRANDKNIDQIPEVRQRLEEVRREVLLIAAVNYVQENEIRVSDRELREYYENNKDRFKEPLSVRVSHILMRREEEAEEVLSRIRQGASFERMAKEHSIDSLTVMEGGDMGYIERGEMTPDFEEAVFSMERVGEISDVIKSPFGYHIIKLTGRKRRSEEGFDENREYIKQRLKEQKFNDLLERYRREYNVRINHDVLGRLDIGENEFEDF